MSKKAKIVTITTPKKDLLYGLWFGPKKPERCLIFVHSLSSSAFSLNKITSNLSDDKTAVLTFSNRGHSTVSKLNKIDKRKKKGYSTSKMAGTAHEVFTECVDDIQGAVDFVRSKGTDNIYLIGHSTGCQKSIYYLSRRGKQKQVKGVVLLCPVSDYAAIKLFVKKEKLNKIVYYAERMKQNAKANDLLPKHVWPHYHSAQRFLSLYTPDSEEEIFTYAQPNKIPHALQKVKIPMLVVYAEADEYHDRPTKEIVSWFKNHSKSVNPAIKVIPEALHGFQKKENDVIKTINSWLKKD